MRFINFNDFPTIMSQSAELRPDCADDVSLFGGGKTRL